MSDKPQGIDRLKIRSEPQDAHFVSLGGELDLSNADALRAEFA